MCNFRIDEVAYCLVSNPWFDRIIIAVILINCAFLALYDPNKESNEQEGYIMVGDMVFSGIFVFELLAKWLALSIPTYFKDNWNWVDFVVVLESVVSLALKAVEINSLDISAFRGLRVLRPLRAVTYIPQVKLLFETVVGSFRVANTLLLCIGCVLLFFGNFGYTCWAGIFYNTCLNTTSYEILDAELVCGSGYSCPDGFSCEARSKGPVVGLGDEGVDLELNHGVTGFYDIWHALLQAFQVVSLDGWQQIMWYTQDAVGEVSWIYFIVLIIMGNVLLVSIFPAVVSTKLEAAIQREDERKREHRLRTGQGFERGRDKKRKPASELEFLLNEYMKKEADEIAVIERMAAVRRGHIIQLPEDEVRPPPWTPFQHYGLGNNLRAAVTDELAPFSILVYCVILMNALVLCLHHAHASDETEHALSALNKAFTVFFVLEMTIKLSLLGPVAYFMDGGNLFDFSITCLGLIEITVKVAGSFTGLRVIRIFRIARVLRLASIRKIDRSQKGTSPQVDIARMVNIVMTSIPWIANIYAVQLLLMYTFAVLGMQFFGNALPDTDSSGDNHIVFNYNSFGKAVNTLLDLLTGNLWDTVLFDTVGATGSKTAILFYVLWLVLSRWLVVAMIVTVLFYRIDVDTEDYLKIAARNSMRSVFALEHAFMQCHKSYAFITWRRRYEDASGNRVSTKGQIKLVEYSPPAAQPGVWQRMRESPRSLLIFEPRHPVRKLCIWLTAPIAGVSSPKAIKTPGLRASVKRRSRTAGERSCWERLPGRLGSQMFARYVMETILMAAVITSLVLVAIDLECYTGRRSRTEHKYATYLGEIVVIGVFVVEAFVLTIARGFIWLPGAYLRDPINLLDFGIMILSVLCFLALNSMAWDNSTAISAIKAVRALRVVRLLKSASGAPELASVLKAIQTSGKALCLAGAVTLFFWMQWSILGLQIWKGSFSYCSDPAMALAHDVQDYHVYRTSDNGIETQLDCINAGYVWKTPRWNFDSFGHALHSVFIIFTLNSWHKILFSAINARVSSPGLNAVEWSNTWAGLYFLCVVLSSLVLVLLFVGVVFSMYTFLNLTKSGERLTSLKQAFWTMYEAKLAHVQPDTIPARPPEGRVIRRFLFNVAMDARWRVAVGCLIGANVVVRFLMGTVSSNYRDAPFWVHAHEDVVMGMLNEGSNSIREYFIHGAPTKAVFSAIFVGDWLCRAVAFGGFRAVTSSPFQVADFLSTMILGFVFIEEIMIMSGIPLVSSSFWTLVEAISMVRLIRLGHLLPDIQELLLVTVKSSSVVFPLLLVLILLTYLWSVCGMILFGNDTYLADLFGGGYPWEAVNRHQGFYSVAQGMQTMLGVATTPGSDGWVTLMERYQEMTPQRWKWGILLFFTSYAFLTRFLLVNLFMMTLLFKYKTHSSDKVGVAMEQVNQFKRAWINYAFLHTKEYGSIYAGQLVALLKELPPPLGVGRDGSYYDSQILAKKVLAIVGIDVVKHVSAKHITEALKLAGTTKQNSYYNLYRGRHPVNAGQGPGYIKLQFSQVLRAVHRVVLFGFTLENERLVAEDRMKARMNLNALKLGVHRFLATSAKRRRHVKSSNLLERVAVENASLLRTQLPMTFMARSSMVLTAEFLRWRDHVDIKGYDHEANAEGRCLLQAASHELDAAMALEQLTSRLVELHSGDHRLFRRLTHIRQHIIVLKELRVKVEAIRGDHLETRWDGTSLRVMQASVIRDYRWTYDALRAQPSDLNAGNRFEIFAGFWKDVMLTRWGYHELTEHPLREVDDACKEGVIAICASADGEWIFCTTENGMLRVFKREKPPRSRLSGKKSGHGGQQGHFVSVQCIGIKGGDRTSSSEGVRGTCVACSPDGFVVVLGCEDSTVRIFAQDIKGLRLAVQAMQAEGKRGKRPTISYRPGPVGKAHKSAVRCVVWLDLGFFYTGGLDGTVCMWRKGSIGRPAQSIDIRRSIFSTEAVQCLTVWRTSYALDLLAACIDLDDKLDVEPPLYLLVGDTAGYLRVLPARTDSKFFAFDIWKPACKHQVTARGAITAIEVAWDRVYTALGSSGTIKAWSPIWTDEANEKLSGFMEVGHYAVHSGAVTSIKYAKGLMFSASHDLSIVTWYPPPEKGSLGHSSDRVRLASPGGPPAVAKRQGDRERNGASSPRGAENGVRVAKHGGEGRQLNDPGFVVHLASVVGLVVIPGAIISADSEGRILVRGPDKLLEVPRVRVLPTEADIVKRRSCAIEVLQTQGRHRRPSAGASVAIAAASGTMGRAAAAEGCAGAGASALVAQAMPDHFYSLRALLRAKAKRRLRDEIRVERQHAVDLHNAKAFVEQMGRAGLGRDHFSRAQLEAANIPRDGDSTVPSTNGSAVGTLKAIRQQSILKSVGRSSAGKAAQDVNKVMNIVEMDQKPNFLLTIDLDQLADLPEVYLAELIHHFLPGKDLAEPLQAEVIPPSSRGQSSSLAKSNGTAGTNGSGGRRRKQFGMSHRFSGLKRDAKSSRSVRMASSFGAATTSAASTGVDNLARMGENVRSSLRIAIGALGSRDDNDMHDGGEPYDTEAAIPDAQWRAEKPQTTARSRFDQIAERMHSRKGMLAWSRGRSGVAGRDSRGVIASLTGTRGPRNLSPNRTFELPSDFEEAIGSKQDDLQRDLGTERIPIREVGGTPGHRSLLHHPPHANDIYTIGDLSNADSQRRSNLTVYVPLTPEPGVWAASIDFEPMRNIDWVLTEALRMYEREHDPLPRCLGLTRKPRLTPGRSSKGLLAGGQTWEQSKVLAGSAIVRAVLRPGEELVVLVDSFDPALAFQPPPSARSCPSSSAIISSGCWERSSIGSQRESGVQGSAPATRAVVSESVSRGTSHPESARSARTRTRTKTPWLASPPQAKEDDTIECGVEQDGPDPYTSDDAEDFLREVQGKLYTQERPPTNDRRHSHLHQGWERVSSSPQPSATQPVEHTQTNRPTQRQWFREKDVPQAAAAREHRALLSTSSGSGSGGNLQHRVDIDDGIRYPFISDGLQKIEEGEATRDDLALG